MMQKGFFTAIIAVSIVALLATMAILQQNISKNTQEQYYQRAVFELKTGTQNMQYLLDKAVSDAVADSIELVCTPANQDTTCCKEPSKEDYETKIGEYFKKITDDSESYYGIECDEITGISLRARDSPEFSFDLKCRRQLPTGFSAEFTKEININKKIELQKKDVPAALPLCLLQVMDMQSYTCDVLVNKTECAPP